MTVHRRLMATPRLRIRQMTARLPKRRSYHPGKCRPTAGSSGDKLGYASIFVGEERQAKAKNGKRRGRGVGTRRTPSVGSIVDRQAGPLDALEFPVGGANRTPDSWKPSCRIGTGFGFTASNALQHDSRLSLVCVLSVFPLLPLR